MLNFDYYKTQIFFIGHKKITVKKNHSTSANHQMSNQGHSSKSCDSLNKNLILLFFPTIGDKNSHQM